MLTIHPYFDELLLLLLTNKEKKRKRDKVTAAAAIVVSILTTASLYRACLPNMDADSEHARTTQDFTETETHADALEMLSPRPFISSLIHRDLPSLPRLQIDTQEWS